MNRFDSIIQAVVVGAILIKGVTTTGTESIAYFTILVPSPVISLGISKIIKGEKNQ